MVWSRLKTASRSGYVWVGAAMMAGFATFVGSSVQNSLRRGVEIASDASCSVGHMFRAKKRPETFSVIIAKLRGDDGSWRDGISQSLVPSTFSVTYACDYGPEFGEREGGDLAETIRKEADEQLEPYDGDLLVFGGVRHGTLFLRFADKHGYCSREEVSYSADPKEAGTISAAFLSAVSEATIEAILSDCEGKKAARMSPPELRLMITRVSALSDLPRLSGASRTNIEWTKAWAKAELAYRTKQLKSGGSLLEDLTSVSGPSEYRAVQLYAILKFAGDHKIQALWEAAQQELADLHNIAKRGTPLWSCTAILAEARVSPANLENDKEATYLWYNGILQGFISSGPITGGCSYGWMVFLARYWRDIASLEFRGDDYHQRLIQTKDSLKFTIEQTKRDRNYTGLNVNWAELQLADTLWRLAEVEHSLLRIQQARLAIFSAKTDKIPGDVALSQDAYVHVMASIAAAERKVSRTSAAKRTNSAR